MSLFLYMCWCICHVNTNLSESAVLCLGWFCCMHPTFPTTITKPALGFLQRLMVRIVCRNCLIWMKFPLSTNNVDIAWMLHCRRPGLAMYISCFPCCPHKSDWNMVHVHGCAVDEPLVSCMIVHFSAHISKWELVCRFGVIFHIFFISCLASRFHAWN